MNELKNTGETANYRILVDNARGRLIRVNQQTTKLREHDLNSCNNTVWIANADDLYNLNMEIAALAGINGQRHNIRLLFDASILQDYDIDVEKGTVTSKEGTHRGEAVRICFRIPGLNLQVGTIILPERAPQKNGDSAPSFTITEVAYAHDEHVYTYRTGPINTMQDLQTVVDSLTDSVRHMAAPHINPANITARSPLEKKAVRFITHELGIAEPEEV